MSVNITSFAAALETISTRLSAGHGFNFFTLNLDHLVKLKADPRFQEAYRNAVLISADGWPIVWLLRHYGHAAQRVTGADLVEPLCARASHDGISAYFVGPDRQPLASALKVLRKRYPNLIISGAESPVLAYDFSNEIVDELADRINNSGAQLCFLSLGAPKQEVLADALRRKCPHVGFLCVGAALDFISGHVTRAPRLIQYLRGEWLWRMMTDPARLAPRYMRCLTLLLEIAWDGQK
jgi:exopolysaccharide biosynthesis WecB/TagA/CpsF family protein